MPLMNAKRYKNWMVKQALRRQRIKDFYAGGKKAGGKSFEEVAAQFHITPGRAWQIVRDYQK
mgnify:CR=1 FL=1